MKLFGKKKYPGGDRKYFFFGLPYLVKKRTGGGCRTYLFGIRISSGRASDDKPVVSFRIKGATDGCDCCMSVSATPKQLAADAREFLRGFDRENAAKAKRIIEKLKTAWGFIERGEFSAGQSDFFTKSEIARFRKMIAREGMRAIGDNYEYNGYVLPRLEYEPSIFHDEYELERLKSADKIRADESLAVIDVGAYIGDSSLILSRHFPNNKIYAVEALPALCKEIVKTVKLNGAENIIPVNLALSDKAGGEITLSYEENKTEKCPVDTLDGFVKKNNLKVGLIKIDVEGAEWALLHGAMETIKSQRPAIIVSIYHNYRDLMKIKPLIDSLGLDYKFSLTDSCYGVYPVHEITLNCEI